MLSACHFSFLKIIIGGFIFEENSLSVSSGSEIALTISNSRQLQQRRRARELKQQILIDMIIAITNKPPTTEATIVTFSDV